MTVAELIDILKAMPQELPVAYSCYSEQILMRPSQIVIDQACIARPDGWIQNERPDMPSVSYCLFPGN
jgi:hypothetical protein